MTTPVPPGGFPALPASFRPLPLGEVYRLIEPGPVVLLTTGREAQVNVMTMSWHMMVEFTPPTIACVVSDADYSASALRETGECVIAVPTSRLARKVVAIGNCSGLVTDKFALTKLTPCRADEVEAPLVAECFANLECRVVDRTLVTTRNLYLLEVVAAWRDQTVTAPKTIHHHGYGTFVVDGRTLTLESAMP